MKVNFSQLILLWAVGQKHIKEELGKLYRGGMEQQDV